MISALGFSKCLLELMNAVELKNSKLAKAINVDASLIYKWLNNKSVPPMNSPHIDSISNHIIKSVITTHQFNAVEGLIKKYFPECGEINETNMFEFVRKLLLEAQGYSIKNNKNRSLKIKPREKEAVNTITKDSHVTNYNPVNCKKFYSEMQIITGYKEVLNASLELLEAANSADVPAKEPILITISSDFNGLIHFSDFSSVWKDLVSSIMLKGWEFTFLLRLNDNSVRNLKIIENIIIPMPTGCYQVFYTNSNNYQPPFEVIIVPKTGALFCLSSSDKHQADSAFLLKNRTALNIIKGYFCQLFASSKPLFRPCTPLECSVFQKEYIDTVDSLGKRYCLKSGLNTLTIPLSLYEKYLGRSGLSSEERMKKLYYHKRRIQSFETQVKHYSFRDIVCYDYIDELVNEGDYPLFDKYYIYPGLTFSNEEIIEHLSYTIQLLKEYDNFEIGLACKDHLEGLWQNSWVIKENSAVIALSYVPVTSGVRGSDKENMTAKVATITEPNITKAFEAYFENLWNTIEPVKKDKNEVIKLLERKISTLQRRK